MRILLISTLLLFSFSTSLANEKLYNKLNKLYLTDQKQCMEQAKKVMKKKSQESIPYYFVSVIYYDKSKESQTLRGTYLQMYRAVTHAAKFEKYSGETERNLVHWNEHITSIKNRSQKLIATLNKNQLNDLSQNLTEQLSKVESIASHFKMEEDTDILEDLLVKNVNTETLKPDANFTKMEGHFYGLPTGSELIISASKTSEQEVLELINEERRKRHLPALIWNEELANASRYHAYDQGTQNYFSHTSNDRINDNLVSVGSTFSRIKRFYKGNPAGECIAAGNRSSEATFNQWKTSDGHAKIMFDSDARYVGIGFVQVEGSSHEYYWVLATGY
jgi:uncharacterized protein YkwD